MGCRSLDTVKSLPIPQIHHLIGAGGVKDSSDAMTMLLAGDGFPRSETFA